MKYQAVIFDLFGTLVDEFDSHLEPMRQEMARALDIPYSDFTKGWTSIAVERGKGVFPTLAENIERAASIVGVKVTAAQVARAVQIRQERTRRAMEPRPDAKSTLNALNAKGCRIGLISNATPGIPDLWLELPLAPLVDVATFSSSVGLMKPDPRIYRTTCQKLGVSPENCLYIGDGSDGELDGAAHVGLKPVLIRMRYDSPSAFRLNGEAWRGPRILTLSQVLDHVE